MNIRSIILFSSIFLFACPVYSQLFKGGVIAGINGSQVDGDSYYGYNKLGLLGGVYIFMPLNKHLDIQLEMEYMGKGAKSVGTIDYPVEYKSQLNYFEIPVLLRYNLIHKIGAEMGLGFGVLINASETLSDGTPTKQNPFKPFELSYILGVSYKINDTFTAIGRFSYSLIAIAPTFTDPNKIILTSGMYNNLFTIGASYQIGGK